MKQKGVALLARGQTQLAIKELNRAVELGATDVETRLQLAKAYQKADNAANAKAAFWSVLRQEWQGPAMIRSTSVLEPGLLQSTNRTATRKRATQRATSPVYTKKATTKRPDTARENSDSVEQREMSQPERAFKEFNRRTSTAGDKAPATPSKVAGEPTDEFSVWGELVLDKKSGKPTCCGPGDWRRARSLFQEFKRQLAARIVLDEDGRRLTPDDFYLDESYNDADAKTTYKCGDGSAGTNITKWNTSLLLIGEDRYLYQWPTADGCDVFLNRVGPTTLTGHCNGRHGKESVDVSVSLSEGRLEQQISWKTHLVGNVGGRPGVEYECLNIYHISGTFSYASPMNRKILQK
jgi:hypothetical protein